MEKKRAYGYDDIVLCPTYSAIESRSEVDVGITLANGIELSLPVIAAPMDTVCDSSMAIAIGLSGGLGIIHRYMSIEEQVVHIKKTLSKIPYVGFACGLHGKDGMDRVVAGVDAGAQLVCVDVAFGATTMSNNMVHEIRKRYGDSVHVMVGNIATESQVTFIDNNTKSISHVDSFRVGIGGGSVCTTSRDTGFGIPTVTSIESVRSGMGYTVNRALIADGGIKYTGDIVKAIAVGADVVMLGSMLAGYKESAGKSVDGEYKEFRGMASREAREEYTKTETKHVEGISTKLLIKDGSVTDLFDSIEANIKSGLSYVGARNLKEFRGRVRYYVTTPAGFQERLPRYAEKTPNGAE